MKILMVCLGNICRSPLAEGIMREKMRKYHIEGEVDSCGFERFHIGDHPDSRAIHEARAHGIDISAHQAKVFVPAFFDYYDRIYVMDQHNFNDVVSMARNTSDTAKVDYIMNAVYPGTNAPVPDPYFGGVADFKKTWELLNEATDRIAAS